MDKNFNLGGATLENKDYEIVEFGDLKPGDKIIGRDGEPVEITDVYDKHIPETMYEIEMEDGEIVQASGNHMWYCETSSDVKNKDNYRRLAEKFFANNEIPEKLEEDELFPLTDIIQIFGNDVNTMLFIEKACKSLGYSSYTPHLIYEDKLKNAEKTEAILNYSYNDFIDFLKNMKETITNNKGYFYFGEVRTTDQIAHLISKGETVNIPHKKDIIDA